MSSLLLRPIHRSLVLSPLPSPTPRTLAYTIALAATSFQTCQAHTCPGLLYLPPSKCLASGTYGEERVQGDVAINRTSCPRLKHRLSLPAPFVF